MTNPTVYALAKQVPAMLGGFTIATRYGDIDISEPDECQAVAALVRALLEKRLANLERRQQEGGNHAPD